jgi:hypothetical protein
MARNDRNLLFPGHQVGRAWAVPASAKPARLKPPDANAANVKPTIPRFRMWVIMVFPLFIACSGCVRVDTDSIATDPHIAGSRSRLRQQAHRRRLAAQVQLRAEADERQLASSDATSQVA